LKDGPNTANLQRENRAIAKNPLQHTVEVWGNQATSDQGGTIYKS